MKLEKWTSALAALGLVTIGPALTAQTTTNAPETAPVPAAPALVPLQTALSATTISGYVDTSAVWNPGTGEANPAPYAFNAGKQNGFNIDDVDIKLAKAFESGKWSAGYVAELNYGPDGTAIDGGAAPIRQAYVDMEVPVGNGLELKLGRWDNLLGYETSDAMNNPNWTRSYGYSFEPTEHTGLLAVYQIADWVGLQVGAADELTTIGGVNARPESRRAVVSLITFTAPTNWGFLGGSTLSAGLDYGPGAYGNAPGLGGGDTTEWYVGTTLNTPAKGLTFGASYDCISDVDVEGYDAGFVEAVAGYGVYKIKDNASISGRVEYANGRALGAAADADNLPGGYAGGVPVSHLDKVFALTGTFEYDLWANVITRLEVRWDHDAGGGGPAFGGEVAGVPTKYNEVLIAANVIYKF